MTARSTNFIVSQASFIQYVANTVARPSVSHVKRRSIWLSVPLVILLKVHQEVAYLLQLVSGGGER